MKLEVGMYVRTINGKIWIITSQKAISGHRKDIIKASHNIIDLIEVGDYVNGKQVIETYYKSDEKWHLEIVDSRLLTHDELKHVNIQSIVTKEQFESMKYSLEG